MGIADAFRGGSMGQATGGADWWKDMNLMQMMLGQAGQAVMGPHQNTWQANVGKMASNMGQSNKFAMASNKREHELMGMLAKAFGQTPAGQRGATKTLINADGTYKSDGNWADLDESGGLKMEGLGDLGGMSGEDKNRLMQLMGGGGGNF